MGNYPVKNDGCGSHKSRMMPDLSKSGKSGNGKGRKERRSGESERRVICSFIDYLEREAREGDDKMIDSLIGYINEGIESRKRGGR